jgi:L-alanine-DL-glutamate epimerase-like enolase superfamily enzyme
MSKPTVEDELRVAQELLFLVLDYISEPVRLDIDQARERMSADRRIDIDLDEQNNQWILSVVDI